MHTFSVVGLDCVSIELDELRLASREGEIEFKPFRLELTRDKPFCAVIGPSGSGKTTFFKSLMPRFHDDWRDLSTVSIRVMVRINGVAVAKNSSEIGYASQSPFFVPHRSVVENLRAPFRWRGQGIPTQDDLDETLTDFQLSGIGDRKAYQLSAGERQRLNVARMFLARPQLAIVDECFSPMDEGMANAMANLVASKYRKSARILVTGHRRSDLTPFLSAEARFTYSDVASARAPVRHVRVKVT